jgi:hypothetical protein
MTMNEGQLGSPENGERKWKNVYTIVEGKTPERKFWLKVGVAFPNRDGSLNVRLDAVPTNGTLHIRDPLPDEGHRGARSESPFGQKGLV